MILRLDHVQLAIPEGGEARARAFFGELLGLPEKQKPAQLAARGGLWFEQDALKLHLGVERDFRPAKKAHPAFVVEALHALAERLRLAGYPVVADEPLDGHERVFVSDPFGNRIELIQA